MVGTERSRSVGDTDARTTTTVTTRADVTIRRDERLTTTARHDGAHHREARRARRGLIDAPLLVVFGPTRPRGRCRTTLDGRARAWRRVRQDNQSDRSRRPARHPRCGARAAGSMRAVAGTERQLAPVRTKADRARDDPDALVAVVLVLVVVRVRRVVQQNARSRLLGLGERVPRSAHPRRADGLHGCVSSTATGGPRPPAPAATSIVVRARLLPGAASRSGGRSGQDLHPLVARLTSPSVPRASGSLASRRYARASFRRADASRPSTASVLVR